ncbi:MAG: hypothetical protein KDB23_25470 [Planctomycetales bacterium]|nr:hypothetical protein [Planctomycetales bacterium]
MNYKTLILIYVLSNAATQQAFASPRYTDILDQTTHWGTSMNEFGFVDCVGETVQVDLDLNGIADLQLETYCSTQMSGGIVNVSHSAVAPAGIVIDRHGAARLDTGTTIGSSAVFAEASKLLFEDRDFGTQGSWDDPQTRFVGLQVEIDDNIHYGWARLSVDRRGITVHDYAYETEPNKLIAAGDGFPSMVMIPSTQSQTISTRADTIDLSLPSPLDLSHHSQFESFDRLGEFNSSVSAAGASASVDSVISPDQFNAAGSVTALGDDNIDVHSAFASYNSVVEFGLVKPALFSLDLKFNGETGVGGPSPTAESHFELQLQGPEGNVYHTVEGAYDCTSELCDFSTSALGASEQGQLPPGQYRLTTQAEAIAGHTASGTFEISFHVIPDDSHEPPVGNALTDLQMRVAFVHDVLETWVGDTNLDGQFDTADLVHVLNAGEYEDAIDGNSTWATGDWSGDREFNSADFVLAFQDGGFDNGQRAAFAAVPEPDTFVLAGLAFVSMCCRRRR